MKLPDYMTRESSHKANVLNTLTLSGISMLWGHMLGLISVWWIPLTILLLLGGYGTEISPRKKDVINV